MHEKHGHLSISSASAAETEVPPAPPSSSQPPSSSSPTPPRFAGWWGHRLSDRFVMGPDFHPSEGAYGFRLSNPPVLLVAGNVSLAPFRHPFYCSPTSFLHLSFFMQHTPSSLPHLNPT